MKYEQIDKKLFVENRELFSIKLKENTLAIFNANDIMPTNADGTVPFRQNNDLFWLCGVDQEESQACTVNQNRICIPRLCKASDCNDNGIPINSKFFFIGY